MPYRIESRLLLPALICLVTWIASGCIGGSQGTGGGLPPPPVANTVAISVDSGPAAALGAINHAYVSIKVCQSGSTTQCATIDHVLLDTGSWGLRLVQSVMSAAKVTLSSETDIQGNVIEECAVFASGQTWGPVALADVALAGESAVKLPVQLLDDTGMSAPAPATCGAGGSLINQVSDWGANGVLGIGVFTADCGAACVDPAIPLPIYYACGSGGSCAPTNVALSSQVTNPVALFTVDNNGIIVKLPSLQSANGDSSVQGELIFGLSTQADNAIPATGLTMLGADAKGDFTTTYNGSNTPLPAIIDSGTDSYSFNDSTIAVCTSAAWVGYYCPAVAPESLFATNASATATAAKVTGGSGTVNFAVADPNTFVANAVAFDGLAGGAGVSNFIWGMPFFYGRTIYVGIEARASGGYEGPYYAY